MSLLFQVFVACVTLEYTKSTPCKSEVALAVLLNKTIVPLRFKEVPWPVEGSMSLPFAELLYVNCREGLTPEKLREIVETINHKVNTNTVQTRWLRCQLI